MKKIGVLLIGFFYFTQISAQNEIDALRYSKQNIFGTAKFSSMGGAFGSLGGDFSSLSLNPAGIAFYQNSEMTITPGFSIIETNASLKGNTFINNKFNEDISEIGFIISGVNESQEWKRINIGFGWNKIADYNNYFYTEAENNISSLSDLLLQQANGNTIENLNSFGSNLAFWSDLIDLQNNSVDTITNWYAFDNGNYISHVIGNSNKTQSKTLNSKGKMGEFVFSIGTSFEEKIYLGATISIPSIEYNENSVYTENNFEDTTYTINSFTYTEDIRAYGDGVNLKLGAIVRIGENTKIGGSIHTPSYISMEEEYKTSISTQWDDREEFRETSPLGYFNYDIITPWKVVGSFSTIFNQQFLISADIEQTDYSFTRMYSDYYQFTDENNLIEDTYTTATNIRVGSEVKFNPFSLRVGYGLYGSPLKDNPEYETENYSIGIGINMQSIFCDVSYSISKQISNHAMYNSESEEFTLVNTDSHYLLFTLGYRF